MTMPETKDREIPKIPRIEDEQFEKAVTQLRERFETEYDMVSAGLARIPDDVTLDSVTINTSITLKRLKKDTEGKMSVEVNASSKIQTAKITGTGKVKDGQFYFNFDSVD